MRNCKKCQQPAAIHLPSYGLSLCSVHFIDFLRNRVKKTISKYKLLNPHERIAVALSGGKDSAVLFQILDYLYAETLDLIGLHIDLGVKSAKYSQESCQHAEKLCKDLDREFICISLEKEYRISMDLVNDKANQLRRSLCGNCGTIKRYLLNKHSLQLDCEKLATGHLLDDEVSVLLINLFNGNTNQLIRMGPNLAGNNGVMVTRIKPLYEISERETTVYTQFAGLPFQDVDCPYAVGATSLKYKKILHDFEKASPGMAISLLQNFIKKILPPLKDFYQKTDKTKVNTCLTCNGPTIDEVCAFCNLRNLLIEEM